MSDIQTIYVFERLENKKWVLASRSPRLNKAQAEKEAKELTAQYTYALYRVVRFEREAPPDLADALERLFKPLYDHARQCCGDTNVIDQVKASIAAQLKVQR